MTLSSQQARPPVKVRYAAPSKKRGVSQRTILGIVLLLAAVGTGLGYMALKSGSTTGTAKKDATPSTGLASTSQVGPVANPLAPPTPQAAPQRNLREESPVVVSMTPPGLNGSTATTTPTSTTTTPAPSTTSPTLLPSTTPTPANITANPSNPSTSPAPSSTPSTNPTPRQPNTRPTSPGTPGATPGTPGAAPGMVPAAPAPTLAQTLLSEAERLQAANKLVEARATLNKALLDNGSTPSDRTAIRKWMSELNQTLIFSPTVAAGDTLTTTYSVVGGDNLEKIMRKEQLLPDKMLIARVNKMTDPNKLRVGQKLKVVKGPFHVVVSKSQYRMDIYAGDALGAGSLNQSSLAEHAEPSWTYITSFTVGLGEKNGTPLGNFIVKANSKLVNPHWVNPRTGEKFDANDPKNPIGERWLGLEGLDDASKKFTGYGIHGTIDPDSVGKEMSMGCVRLGTADVEVVYELLTPKISVVKIVP